MADSSDDEIEFLGTTNQNNHAHSTASKISNDDVEFLGTNSGKSSNNNQFDPNNMDHPELAMALRISMEEERSRQKERAAVVADANNKEEKSGESGGNNVEGVSLDLAEVRAAAARKCQQQKQQQLNVNHQSVGVTNNNADTKVGSDPLADTRKLLAQKYQQHKSEEKIDTTANNFGGLSGMTAIASSATNNALPAGIQGSLDNKHSYLRADKGKYDPNKTGRIRGAGGVIKDSHPDTKSEGGWIWVNNPNYNYNSCSRVDSPEDVQRLIAEFQTLEGTNYTHGKIVDMGKTNRVLHGKWLLDISPDNVERDWPLIRNACLQGKLASTAKISDTPGGGFYKVCIYTPNFDDKAEVLRVRQAILNDVQISTDSILRYKLDAFTYCGVYSATGSKIRTTTYDCGGLNDLQCTTLITAHETCTKTGVSCPRCYPSCLPESTATKKAKSTTTMNDDQSICTGLEMMVVGIAHRRKNLKALDSLSLVREPNNPHDRNAIACKNGEGGVVGYLPSTNKNTALVLAPELDAHVIKIGNVSLLRQTNSTLRISVDLHLKDTGKKQHFQNVLKQLGAKFTSAKKAASNGKKTDVMTKVKKQSQSMKENDDEQWNDGCSSDDDQKPIANVALDSKQQSNFRNHSASTNCGIPIRVVSWNISEVPSHSPVSDAAPNSYARREESARLIRDECFRATSQHGNGNTYYPDIIALQETDHNWGTQVFGPSGYVSVGQQHSHCGFVDLLVRRDFSPVRVELDNGWSNSSLPSVATIITLPNKTKVAIASNHLAPFGEGAAERENECRLLMGILTSKCDNVILIGDFNMREKENKKIEGLVGGGWLDAWREKGSKATKFTWDSFKNFFHNNGFGFNCRFDRCYVRGDELTINNFDLIGNRPVNGVEGDYLSDHFGMVVDIMVNPPSSAAKNQQKKVVKTVAKSSKKISIPNAGDSSWDIKPPAKVQGFDDSNVKYFQFEEGTMKSFKSSKSKTTKAELPQSTHSDSDGDESDSDDEFDVNDYFEQAKKRRQEAMGLSTSNGSGKKGGKKTNTKSKASSKKKSPPPPRRRQPQKSQQQESDELSRDCDNHIGSEETTLRTNGKRARSGKTTTAAKSDDVRGGSKKQQQQRAKAAKIKRCRLDSSSSSDEGFEDMKRRLREKNKGKQCKKKPHLADNFSSDEDF